MVSASNTLFIDFRHGIIPRGRHNWPLAWPSPTRVCEFEIHELPTMLRMVFDQFATIIMN